MITEVTTHDSEAKALAPGYLQGQPNWEALIGTFTPQIQDLETALVDLITERTIDTADTAVLNQLGRLVGQERGGAADALFRNYIRGRIAANRSLGTWEDLINICVLVINDGSETITLTQSDYMTVLVKISGVVLTADQHTVLLGLLNDGVAAGERILLFTNLYADTTDLILGPTAEVASPITIADATVTVDSTAGFDSSGDAKIDGSDTFSYTGLTATTFTGCTGITSNHASGVNIIQTSDTTQGLANYPATQGGFFENVLEE